MEKAYLVLSDGSVFAGTRIGAGGDCVGELVFATGMVGYLETLTDPGYAGQIVMQTFPLIGNYGVMEADFEGDCALHGYVAREICAGPSNFRSQYDLDTFLKDRGIPGVCGIDTRLLTTKLREQGVMNAMICAEVPEDLSVLNDYRVQNVVEKVSRKTVEVFPAAGEKKYRVVLLDFGTKRSLIEALTSRGCEVVALPHDTSADDILARWPDGLVLSCGPGDPREQEGAVKQISRMVGLKPIFGVGLGHQLLALAQGGRVEKMLCGHRGDNQPVRDLGTGRTVITSQNHGYCVDPDSLKGVAQARWQNANDGTCEGLEYPDDNCFSVQFYPEAMTGARDTQKLMERFIDMMGGNN